MTTADHGATAAPEIGAASGWDLSDTAIAVVLAIVTVALHPVGRILSVPYWQDEAWVADLTRGSWATVARIGSPTPVGFVALLKLVPASGNQRARLVPLAFCALTVVMAYVLARSIEQGSRTTRRLAAVAVAGAVMVAPMSLERNDLKQYSCDAFCALVILTVAAAADRERSRVPLWCVGAVSVVLLPFSSTSAFVSAAAFAGLFASAWLSHDRDRLRRTALVGSATIALSAIYYLAVVLPKLGNTLTAYWKAFYLSGSPLKTLEDVATRIHSAGSALGLPGLAVLALVVLGVVVLMRSDARALGIAVCVLWFEMLALGRLHKYPFLDIRTSNFLLVPTIAVGAIGAVGAVEWLARSYRPAIAAVVAVLLPAIFLAGSVPHIHDLAIRPEDVRTPTRNVAALRRPRDVILVSEPASFGFAYYWPGRTPVLQADSTGVGFRPHVPGVDAIYVNGRSFAAVVAGLREALRRWRAAGPTARLFVIRTHITRAEAAAWRRALATTGAHPRNFFKYAGEQSYVLGPPIHLNHRKPNG